MVEIKSKDDFLSAVVHILANRPDANIMLLIDGNGPLEAIQTQQSFIWTFGVLAAAEKMFDERYRALMDAEANRQIEAKTNAELADGMSIGERKAN